jgi:hypothetical protein
MTGQTTGQSSNHFTNVIDEVESAPQAQRAEKLISGIAQQMQQSGNPTLQQWGTELTQVKTQLTKACQP